MQKTERTLEMDVCEKCLLIAHAKGSSTQVRFSKDNKKCEECGKNPAFWNVVLEA